MRRARHAERCAPTFGDDGPVELARASTRSRVADAIERLLDDPALRGADAARGGASWSAERTWAAAAAQVEAGLRAALSAR